MTSKIKRLGVGTLALGLCLTVGMSMGAEAKKKKTKAAGPVTVTNTSPRPIPDALAGSATTPATFGKLATPLNIAGKQLKGLKVGDVRVTFQTTGLTATSANDLTFRLTAPNGRTVTGLGNGFTPFSGQSIGPVTLTANSPVDICTGSAAPPPPPCDDPDQTLGPPYFGTAGDVGLSFFEGVAMQGTWTLSVLDVNDLDTSTLNSVSLTVAPQPPITTAPSTKSKKKK